MGGGAEKEPDVGTLSVLYEAVRGPHIPKNVTICSENKLIDNLLRN